MNNSVKPWKSESRVALILANSILPETKSIQVKHLI
jgi:hypothetical protein